MIPPPVLVVFDLETVYPDLKEPVGFTDSSGNYVVDPYQILCSRIWQLAFVTQDEEFEEYVHPGFPVEKLSSSSKGFLKAQDISVLEKIHRSHTIASIWPSFCKWLLRISNGRKNVILVAQQVCHNDEIVLAVEMARHGLKWPEELNVYAVEALPYVQSVMISQGVKRTGTWSVSSLYKDLTGKQTDKAHRALEDAKCLLKNLQICWALKLFSCFDLACPDSHLITVGERAESMEWLFWMSAQNVLGLIPEIPRDHRQSIWSLTTSTRRAAHQWPRKLASVLEDEFGIYTISDLVQKTECVEFCDKLRTNRTIEELWRFVQNELAYRKRKPKSRYLSYGEGFFIQREEANGRAIPVCTK